MTFSAGTRLGPYEILSRVILVTGLE